MRRILALLLVIAVAAAGAYYFLVEWSGAPAEAGYRLAEIERGEIIATVNATGTINPTTTVIVGSQLSGQVVEVLADYNSKVEAGQVVARLNSDQIRAKLDAARADLAQMQANQKVQQAQIERVRADTDKARAAQTDIEAQIARAEALSADAQRAFERQRELKDKGFAAQSAFDTAQAQRDAQRAAVASVRAQLLSARAQIVGLAADLKVAQANLAAVTAQIAQRAAIVRQIEVDIRNSEIRSPVSGVVVQRNVELGQTVAASLQAPTLFLIAEDLHRMEIAASIDETDVGRVKPGQRVSFTVNAYPGRTFDGTVKLVRLGSQTVQNVVTYTTIIAVSNPRLELLPGMTANLRVETDRRNDVLRIPNAALRWRPPVASIEQPAARGPGGPPGAGGGNRPGGRRPGGAGGNLREMIAALKSEVKLTTDQTKEVDAAVGDVRKSVMGLGEMAPAERRERFRTVREELVTRISAVLTAEQRPTFDSIRARFAEEAARGGQTARVFVVDADDNPKGVTIRIGASDGGQTEVLSGALEAGQEVIIGGGPRTAGARPRGRRFGL
jgi:HlyD family secretion protein